MRRRYIQAQDGQLIEVGDDYVNMRTTDSHNVIPDIQPYRSMIDGSVISSRSKHRAHLKAHGCIEVGNDSSVLNAKKKPLAPPPGLKETVVRVVNEKLRW